MTSNTSPVVGKYPIFSGNSRFFLDLARLQPKFPGVLLPGYLGITESLFGSSMNTSPVRKLFSGPIDIVGDIHGEIDALECITALHTRAALWRNETVTSTIPVNPGLHLSSPAQWYPTRHRVDNRPGVDSMLR